MRWYLTLSTGRCVQSPRSAASDTVVRDFGRVLAEGGGEVGGLTIRVEPGTHVGGVVFTLGTATQPLLRGVPCIDDTAPAAWWRIALDGYAASEAVVTPPRKLVAPSGRPWLAVHLLAAAARPDAHRLIPLLGDAGRCAAWALLEARGETPLPPQMGG